MGLAISGATPAHSMGWNIEYVHDSWWAYDPNDGQLLHYDSNDHTYDHVAYVSECISDIDDAVHFVPRMRYRFRLWLPDGERVYYDPKDGEWGNVNKDGESEHCGYLKELKKANVRVAREIIDAQPDEEEVVPDDIDDEDSENEESEESEDEESEDEASDVESSDDEESEDEAESPYFNRYDYLVFPTVNEEGCCLGLSLYWIFERMTEDETLEETAIDYDDGRAMQRTFEGWISWDYATTPGILLDDPDMECEVRWFDGGDAVENALDHLFERRGSYVLVFTQRTGRICHAVAARTEQENSFFDANQGVFRTPSERTLRLLLEDYFNDGWAIEIYVIKMTTPPE